MVVQQTSETLDGNQTKSAALANEAVRSVEAGEGVGSVSDELIFSSQRS